MKKALIVLLVLASSTFTTTMSFADPLDDAIKARRAYYQVVKFNAGPLFGMAKGKVAYDAKKAQTFADNLKAMTAMKNSAMWPKGSDNTAKKGSTRALPAIWSTYPDIVNKSKAYVQAVTELAAAAGKGADALKPKVAALGASCAACHKAFRAKDF